MLREHQAELEDASLLALLQGFVQGNADGRGALPWTDRLLLQDRERLRSDLTLVLSEPEETGEPLDREEITEILREWADVADWDGPLVRATGLPREHRFSVDFGPRYHQALACAPPAVQRAMHVLLTEFLPEYPKDAERLPRGQLKKLNERDVGQIDLPDAYRLRYLIDKPARAVNIALVALGAIALGSYAYSEGAEPSNSAAVKTWSFDQDKIGAIAAGWTNVTGTWQVVEDPTAPSGGKVLAQVSNNHTGGYFNVAVADAPEYKDVEISVKSKAVAGSEDQSGGPV
jgi:hypothetical protein